MATQLIIEEILQDRAWADGVHRPPPSHQKCCGPWSYSDRAPTVSANAHKPRGAMCTFIETYPQNTEEF